MEKQKQPPEVFLKISQNSQEDTFDRVSFWQILRRQACNFNKKEALAQVFSCEFCQISINTFSYRTLLVAASGKVNYDHNNKAFWKDFLLKLKGK